MDMTPAFAGARRATRPRRGTIWFREKRLQEGAEKFFSSEIEELMPVVDSDAIAVAA